MAALVTANCAAGATANHAINCSVIVATSRQPTLHFDNNGATAAVVLVSNIPVIPGRSVVTVVGIVPVVGIWIIKGIWVLERVPPKRKPEVEEDEIVEMMMKTMTAEIMTVKTAASHSGSYTATRSRCAAMHMSLGPCSRNREQPQGDAAKNNQSVPFHNG